MEHSRLELGAGAKCHPDLIPAWFGIHLASSSFESLEPQSQTNRCDTFEFFRPIRQRGFSLRRVCSGLIQSHVDMPIFNEVLGLIGQRGSGFFV